MSGLKLCRSICLNNFLKLIQLSIASKGSIVMSFLKWSLQARIDTGSTSWEGGGVRMPIIIVCKGFQSLAYIGIDPVKF